MPSLEGGGRPTVLQKRSPSTGSQVQGSVQADPALEVFSIHEAAAFLGVHEQTVRRLARRGGIPCFKVGRDWRFRREAIFHWTEEQQQGHGLCSVLIVDDDEKVGKAMARMLERIGCRVRIATGGREGLDLVLREAPDLILLDLMMPNMSGPQFLAELRKTHPTLPVVIVSGYPDGALMQEASGFPPILLLAKPVESALLERTVRSVMGGKMTSVTKVS